MSHPVILAARRTKGGRFGHSSYSAVLLIVAIQLVLSFLFNEHLPCRPFSLPARGSGLAVGIVALAGWNGNG